MHRRKETCQRIPKFRKPGFGDESNEQEMVSEGDEARLPPPLTKKTNTELSLATSFGFTNEAEESTDEELEEEENKIEEERSRGKAPLPDEKIQDCRSDTTKEPKTVGNNSKNIKTIHFTRKAKNGTAILVNFHCRAPRR